MPDAKPLSAMDAASLLAGLNLHRTSTPCLKMLSAALSSYVENENDCEPERVENGETEPQEATLARALLDQVNQEFVERLGVDFRPAARPTRKKPVAPAP